ncbi:hypothetical protein HELRODRAFT_190871 [Helobdella robusta]|uniref:CRAL-TRIO domain-containing protein n=1 Tax=Helobdella robusta TaxID=6412 RepID=T1FSD4_HELRO|nr:hypothetical protein HELRODRAFT_190871 [Helobdella robusta]ESO08070.1 hypothetical protein HELRODRAFT_190871 [Helobdella robusta]
MDESKEDSVAKLRKVLNNLLKDDDDVDDHDLNKWLIARNYDVSKAEAMFRESMKFRKAKYVDTLFDTYQIAEVLQKYFPGGFVGFDKTGSPVVVELFGQYDMEGIMRSCRRSDLEKVKLFQCEFTVRLWRDQTKKLGKRVDNLTVIFDMEGVGTKFLWKPGLDMYISLIKLLEDNYPEMLKRLCVVNAPAIFPYLWNLVTPLVSPEMRQKIVVLKKR